MEKEYKQQTLYDQYICIIYNNIRHLVTKTFTTLHYTLHFISFQLQPDTLHYPLIWLDFQEERVL